MSQRTIDSDVQAAAQSKEFNYVVFARLEFPSGTVRVHNSVGTLSFGGEDYLGVGAFGSIEPMKESIALVDNPVRITLSSITQEIIDAVKTDDIYRRNADIYVGALNPETGTLTGTPINWISGFMEHASVLIGQKNGVMIQIQTRAGRLRQSNHLRFTLEDHQITYSDDLYFEFLPQVQDARVQWVTPAEDNSGGGSGDDRGYHDRRRHTDEY